MKRRIVIVGGGLAGIAAAVRVAEAGDAPILLESSRRLGGRATSYVDPRSGRTVDNCQHVLMGCCTNLIDLYDRLGVADRITWHTRFAWTDGRRTDELVPSRRLPAPLHLAPSMRRMDLLSRDDRRAIARAMWRIIRLGAKGRHAWRDRTFRAFLDETGQPESAVERFWSPVIVSACNLAVDRVGAAPALQVFQEGFLANRWSCAMGVPAVPLVELYDPVAPWLEARGGSVRLGTPVRSIAYDGKRVTGAVTAEGLVEGAAVIGAVPFDRLERLVGDALRRADRRLVDLDAWETSPILGVHLVFETRVMDEPHLTVLDAGVQWLFDKGVDDAGRQHLHAVISAADDWMDFDEDAIARRVVDDLHRVLPRSVGLEPVDVRAIKQRRATFAATPESETRRPSAAPGTVGLGGGGVPNLFLAGDWCDTGWPATMEGAVRSGYAAAAAATGEGGVVEDVPPGALARLLGL